MLKRYVLNGPSTVIEADDRDPAVSWENHLKRTHRLRGGVDLVAAVGTDVLAPTDGRMEHVPDDGSAGNSCRFYHDANVGWKDVFSHLSEYTAESGTWFRQGEVIAKSGDTGGVAPHLHRHLLDPDGVRQNPFGLFSRAGFASLDDEMGADMPTYELIQTPDGTVWFCVDRVTRYGMPDEGVLADYVFFIQQKGQNARILKQKNGNSFGMPVFADGMLVSARETAAVSPAAIKAAVIEALNRVSASNTASRADMGEAIENAGRLP